MRANAVFGSGPVYLSGDAERAIVFDKRTCQYELHECQRDSATHRALRSSSDLSFFEGISSPLLLYRLCCLFPVEVDTEEHVDRCVGGWTETAHTPETRKGPTTARRWVGATRGRYQGAQWARARAAHQGASG